MKVWREQGNIRISIITYKEKTKNAYDVFYTIEGSTLPVLVKLYNYYLKEKTKNVIKTIENCEWQHAIEVVDYTEEKVILEEKTFFGRFDSSIISDIFEIFPNITKRRIQDWNRYELAKVLSYLKKQADKEISSINSSTNKRLKLLKANEIIEEDAIIL